MNKTETTVAQSLNELLDVYEIECMNLREWLGENFDKTVSRRAVDLAKKLEKELKNLKGSR